MNEKTRCRSKTYKRKKTVSAEKSTDNTQLIKMLDERAQFSKKVTITLTDFNDLKDCKKQFEDFKEIINQEKKLFSSEIHSLKSTKKHLLQENENLKLRIKELESKSNPEDSLSKIKQSLEKLETLVAQRAENGKKILLRIHKLLAKHARVLLEQALTTSGKGKLTTGIKKISESTSALEKILGAGIENIPDDNTEIYKLALEKMKTQTLMLREKLKELENGEGLKRIIEEQEGRIEVLVREKEQLKNYICELKENLKQSVRTEWTRRESERRSESFSPQGSPERRYVSYIDHDEKDLQREIASLDSEIQQLQSSLKRALVHN